MPNDEENYNITFPKRCNSNFSDPTNILSVQELRSRLVNGYVTKFDDEDVNRIRNEDWWLHQFLKSVDYDVDVANAIVLECLKWRKSFAVDRISLLELKPLLDNQLMYIHGTDQKNRKLLWINMKNYKPGDNGFQKLFIFWIDRHYMEYKGGEPLTIIIDMTGTGLKNMSFEIMKFIIHAAKYYYPNLIESIIVYDSPSILNASWKVISSWIETSNIRNNLLTFVTKASVHHYIPKSSLQAHQGGTDTFKFTMDELAKCLPPPPPPKPNQKIISQKSVDDMGNNNNNNVSPELDFTAFYKRNVKFEDESTPKRAMSISRRSSKGPKGRKSHIPPSLRPIIEKRVNSPPDEWQSNDFVSLTPRDGIRLDKVDGENDYVDVLLVKNLSPDMPLMFKFKTTSPEKFRVRPSCGLVQAGATEIIRIYLQYEYRNSWSKEKFLLLATETTEQDIDKFSEIYKTSEKKAEYKLKCRMSENVVIDTPDEQKSKYLMALKENQHANMNNFIPYILIVTLLIFSIFQLIYIFQVKSDNNMLRETIINLSNQMKSTVNAPNADTNIEL